MVALVLTAFHEVVKPIAIERCQVNPKIGVHLRSIMDEKRFVTDNVLHVTNVFKNVVRRPSSDGAWSSFHNKQAGAGVVEGCG